MTGPRTRLAEAADAERIAAVHERSREAAYRDLEPNAWMDGWTQERRVAAWTDRLSRSGTSVWVAERDDASLTGFCALALPSRDDDADEDTAEIAALYVDPATWRGGVGRALMGAALGQLAGRGFSEVTLWVFEANARARAFYERFGFAADGATQTLRLEPQELRMRRAL